MAVARIRRPCRSFAMLAACACLGAWPARSGEAPLGWTYLADVLPPGAGEFEPRSFPEPGISGRFQIAGCPGVSQIDLFRNGLDGLTAVSGPRPARTRARVAA